jgi:hypothetical protein
MDLLMLVEELQRERERTDRLILQISDCQTEPLRTSRTRRAPVYPINRRPRRIVPPNDPKTQSKTVTANSIQRQEKWALRENSEKPPIRGHLGVLPFLGFPATESRAGGRSGNRALPTAACFGDDGHCHRENRPGN